MYLGIYRVQSMEENDIFMYLGIYRVQSMDENDIFMYLGIYRVQSMDENDVGLYTCMSENLNPVSVQLLLLPGKP